MRGLVTWGLWKERNDVTFSGQQANPYLVCKTVWLNLIDYGRVAWNKTHKKWKQAKSNKKRKIMEEFRSMWCRRNVLATWV